MLVADSISLSYYNLDVLKGCYLQCRQGEILGMLGRNGSGKSSLLKVIFGSVLPDFGLVSIDSIRYKRTFHSGKVAYLGQDNFLLPFQKTNTLLREIGSGGVEMPQDFPATVKDKRISELSGGQLRLLECLWILSRPADYLLLDEPFSGVAPLHIEFLQGSIREQAKKKSIILTDHLYRPLLAIADRIVLLHNCSVYHIHNEEDLVTHQYISAL